MSATRTTARASNSMRSDEIASHSASHLDSTPCFPERNHVCSVPVPATSRKPGHPWPGRACFLGPPSRRAALSQPSRPWPLPAVFLRGFMPRASFGNSRNSRRTCCNLNGGSGFCRFLRLHAAGCGSLRSRNSRRTLTGSPAPLRHRSKGSARRRPRRPQSGGRGTSGSAASPPSVSAPTTWRPRG